MELSLNDIAELCRHREAGSCVVRHELPRLGSEAHRCLELSVLLIDPANPMLRVRIVTYPQSALAKEFVVSLRLLEHLDEAMLAVLSEAAHNKRRTDAKDDTNAYSGDGGLDDGMRDSRGPRRGGEALRERLLHRLLRRLQNADVFFRGDLPAAR